VSATYELTTDSGIRFHANVHGHLDIYFGAQIMASLPVGDTLTADEFTGTVNDWLCDNLDELDGYWDAAFRATVAEGMA